MKKVKNVMIFGTFDLVHQGHMALFKQAKKKGNQVVAVVGRDERVKQIKQSEPIHTERERKQLLEQIKLIDRVVLGDKHDVYKVIKRLKPDVILLGYDQTVFTDKLQEKIQEFGLKTKIERAKPYKETKLKSSAIRKQLETRI